LPDPLVTGVHQLRQVVVGDDAVALGAAETQQPGASGRSGLADGRSGAHALPSSSPAPSSRSTGVVDGPTLTPLRSRRTRPESVPAGGNSTTARTPRSAKAAMQLSQRTGLVTWETKRSTISSPADTTAPSALDSSGSSASLAVIFSACLASASRAGAMNRVWNAPATGSGRTRAPSGGCSASSASASCGPAATI